MAATMTLKIDTDSLSASGAGVSNVLGRGGFPGKITGIEDNGRRQIHIYGTFSATYKIEGSLNNSNWYDIITGLTTEKYYGLDVPVPYVRVNVTSYTSGTVSVLYGKAVTQVIDS